MLIDSRMHLTSMHISIAISALVPALAMKSFRPRDYSSMQSISILCYGARAQTVVAMAQIAHDHPDLYYKPVDVRRFMRADPGQPGRRYRAEHTTNADFIATQLALLDDPHFFDAVAYFYELCETLPFGDPGPNDCGKVLPLFCSAGVRRSDGIAKAVADKILNKLRRDGTRTFNAKVFSCQNAMPDRLEETVCKEAIKWLRKLWVLQESSDWGCNAAESNSRAFKQMQWIEGLGRICCGEPLKVLDIDTRKPSHDLSDSGEELDVRPSHPHQPLHPPPSPPRRGRSMAPQTMPKAMPVLRSRSPVGAKPDGKSRRGQPTPKTKPSRDKHRRAPTPPRKEPSPSHHAASSAHGRGGTAGEVTCPCCDGRGRIVDTVEPWMAVDADPRARASILEKHGADQYATSDWFTLAAHADGRTAALRLLHNVLKKSSGGHEIQNVNGFLVRGIRNAWHDIVT
jgi:hypothetical protein